VTKLRKMWVLIDLSNSNPGSHNYLWWFETKKQAVEHKRRQRKLKHAARLSAPQAWYRLEDSK
jgi:hypothetical protein